MNLIIIFEVCNEIKYSREVVLCQIAVLLVYGGCYHVDGNAVFLCAVVTVEIVEFDVV